MNLRVPANISIAESDTDIERCFPVIVQFRELSSKKDLLKKVKQQQRLGYKIAFLEDKGEVKAVAGFRIVESLMHGKFLYLDDLITDEKERGKGYGDLMFNWVVKHAKSLSCQALHLDCRVHRFDTHRFYMKHYMKITAHHFTLDLSDSGKEDK